MITFGLRAVPAILLAELLGPKEGLTVVLPAAAIAALAAMAGAASRRQLGDEPTASLRVRVLVLGAAPVTAAVSAAFGPLNLALNGIAARRHASRPPSCRGSSATTSAPPRRAPASPQPSARGPRDRRELIERLAATARAGGALLTWAPTSAART